MTDAGRDYSANPAGPTVRLIEENEGILKLLALVARHTPAESADLMPDWVAWLHEETNIAADSSSRAALRTRLEYLGDRGFVSRSGRTVEITPSGRAWLGQGESQPSAPSTWSAASTWGSPPSARWYR